MKMRTRILAPGGRAWARLSRSVPLPDGLPDRAAVTIVATDHPYYTVADASGRTFQLQWTQLDAGADYCGPAGNWLPEEHPKVRAALQQELDRHLATPPAPGASVTALTTREEYRDQLQWVLERTRARNEAGRPRCSTAPSDSIR